MNATWVDAQWFGFDTETTGVSPTDDRIVTASIVTSESGAKGGSLVSRDWLADPGVAIPERATAIHGISTEYARANGRPPKDVLNEVNEALEGQLRAGQIVVVFNAGYDLPLLEADSKRHGVLPLAERLTSVAPVIDPLVLDRAMDRYRKGKRTLGDLCAFYGVPPIGTAHTADADAAMTLRLLEKMLEKYPALAEKDGGEITEFQRGAHAAWAENFESFLRSRGRDSHISRTWF